MRKKKRSRGGGRRWAWRGIVCSGCKVSYKGFHVLHEGRGETHFTTPLSLGMTTRSMQDFGNYKGWCKIFFFLSWNFKMKYSKSENNARVKRNSGRNRKDCYLTWNMFQLKIRVSAFNCCFMVASFIIAISKEFKMHQVGIGIIENMPWNLVEKMKVWV